MQCDQQQPQRLQENQGITMFRIGIQTLTDGADELPQYLESSQLLPDAQAQEPCTPHEEEPYTPPNLPSTSWRSKICPRTPKRRLRPQGSAGSTPSSLRSPVDSWSSDTSNTNSPVVAVQRLFAHKLLKAKLDLVMVAHDDRGEGQHEADCQIVTSSNEKSGVGR